MNFDVRTLGPAIGSTTSRLILLTLASVMLLAAGDISSTNSDRLVTNADDSILAPMTSADVSAANAALAATLPADMILPADPVVGGPALAPTPSRAAPAANNLVQLVNAIASDDRADSDMHCLATAVYFEARGEPLEGQLAVAQAIRNRVESGRYAASVCGVINQRGQFSFDRRRVPTSGRDWQTAQAIARIASDDMWREVAPRAISFHAARLSPGWRGKVRVAQIGNHVFYR